MALNTTMGGICAPSTFTAPQLFGTETLQIHAAIVQDFTMHSDISFRFTHPPITAQHLSFCNVTVAYTHPGIDDVVHVEVWLPATGWNSRLYAVGGGGFAPGRFYLSRGTMAGALAEGYATVTTDAGMGYDASPADPGSWALSSPGNVNLNLLQNFGSTSLNEQAIIAKSFIHDFYGQAPDYSYWNGCSQGGRQGLVIAQRYPNAYDGILAGATAPNMPQTMPYFYWPQQVMNELGEYPPACEIDAIVQASTTHCDSLDGIEDGLISDMDACLDSFDPFSQVGRVIDCDTFGDERPISSAAATVVNASWFGLTTEVGQRLFQGLNPGTVLTQNSAGVPLLAGTACSSDGACTGVGNPLGISWIRYFLVKDPDFDYTDVARDDFLRLVRQGIRELGSLVDADDADLSRLRDVGGKLITWHGLSDELISSRGTRAYYNDVSSLFPDVSSFYKHYEIPGLGHCSGGAGGSPTAMFEQLRAWVEEGVAPEDSPVSYQIGGTTWDRVVCPYPRRAVMEEGCGDEKAAECWRCV
ncbi:hypothetical protein S40285_03629 [Stachybotrys chlorohalonatus IBT 40285]|uniref:Carboxylic ester hydrolase n=1 Tax=Stachybotrys chlorohalonatus (strain IBT 40285) TaxID=1283841 RepID=A0A084QTL0_STAC4|nr:hypothetical protein S40285_03629 [Stachybotrys chlorohalonata IBT 40285]